MVKEYFEKIPTVLLQIHHIIGRIKGMKELNKQVKGGVCHENWVYRSR